MRAKTPEFYLPMAVRWMKNQNRYEEWLKLCERFPYTKPDRILVQLWVENQPDFWQDRLRNLLGWK